MLKFKAQIDHPCLFGDICNLMCPFCAVERHSLGQMEDVLVPLFDAVKIFVNVHIRHQQDSRMSTESPAPLGLLF